MTEANRWAGDRLGLPETGKNSLAKVPRRAIALLVDWFACMLISQAFFGGDSSVTLAIFALEQWILTATVGSSFGHRLCGLRLIRLDGKAIGVWRSLLRVGAVLLVLPALIWDADNRGLHDKLAGTALVRI